MFLSKFKHFNVKIKHDFNRITADCARETGASIAHYRRLGPRNRRADCALPPITPARELSAPHRRVDTGFILEKKSGAIVSSFIANYCWLRPADGRTDTFSFSTIINIDAFVQSKFLSFLAKFIRSWKIKYLVLMIFQ